MKLDKKIYSFASDAINARVAIDVTPGLYINQKDPQICINLDSVTCSLKVNVSFMNTKTVIKELASVSEDLA